MKRPVLPSFTTLPREGTVYKWCPTVSHPTLVLPDNLMHQEVHKGKGWHVYKKKIHRKISVCCSLVREGFPRESANQARPGSVVIITASQEEHWRGLCNIESAATYPVCKMGRKHNYSPQSNEVQISRCPCPSGWFTAFISS